MENSCSCNTCKSGCTHKPGWFLPGEAEQTAKLLNISLEKLFQDKLAVDYWEANSPTFILAPAVVGNGTGTEYPGNPRGTCIFYKDGLCEIHGAKPYECREYMHSDSHETVDKRHREIMEAWNNDVAQTQIKELLGRQPHTKEFQGSFFGKFFGF